MILRLSTEEIKSFLIDNFFDEIVDASSTVTAGRLEGLSHTLSTAVSGG